MDQVCETLRFVEDTFHLFIPREIVDTPGQVDYCSHPCEQLSTFFDLDQIAMIASLLAMDDLVGECSPSQGRYAIPFIMRIICQKKNQIRRLGTKTV